MASFACLAVAGASLSFPVVVGYDEAEELSKDAVTPLVGLENLLGRVFFEQIKIRKSFGSRFRAEESFGRGPFRLHSDQF